MLGFKGARLRAGVSAKDASCAIGVSETAVFAWEQGLYKPRADKLIQLARFYGCSIDDLLTEDSVTDQESDKAD